MNRKQEQAELFVKLGTLFGPVLKWVDSPSTYDSDEKTRILARFFAEYQNYLEAFLLFSRSEAGHNYQQQYFQVSGSLCALPNIAMRLGQQEFCDKVKLAYKQCFDALCEIPVPIESTIHESHTPFSTYCLIKNLCSTVRERIIWMDRYFDASLFGRYLSDVPPAASITLVTYPIQSFSGKKDIQRYNDFLSVSKLFAMERGVATYRLLSSVDFHDRWFECDNNMLSFGGSIKDLGNGTTFTVSKLDTSIENQQHFDAAIAQGSELFGPSTPNHP